MDYVLTGHMWETRDRIKRAIEATGNRVVAKPLHSETVLVVGNNVASADGKLVKETSKLLAARALGCTVVHESVARKQLAGHSGAAMILGIASTSNAEDVRRHQAALKAQATRTANRTTEQTATRKRAAKADKAALARVLATMESPDDVFGDL